jgi:putative ABC transport system permease protein
VRAPDVGRFVLAALAGHRLRTGLSLLGVAIGVAAVLLLTSLGEGARIFVTSEFSALGTNLLIVMPGKTETTGALPVVGGVPSDLTLDDVEAIRRRVPEVRRLAPIVVGQGIARAGETSRELTVCGTTSELLPLRKIPVHVGRFLPAGEIGRGERVCVLGSTIARDLFAGGNPLGEVVRVGEERFRVIGTLEPRGLSTGLDLDAFLYVPISEAMRIFDIHSVFRLLLEVDANENVPVARRRVLELLTERHDGEEDVTILTQDSVVATFGKIFSILTAALGGIAAVSLSVAGVGIMNVMLVSVSERTREIGLLKALGASRRQVLVLFLSEASLLSVSGGLAGLAVGFAGIAALRFAYPAFPAEPPGWAVAAALATSLAVGIVFGVLPARRAADLDPIAALGRGA